MPKLFCPTSVFMLAVCVVAVGCIAPPGALEDENVELENLDGIAAADGELMDEPFYFGPEGEEMVEGEVSVGGITSVYSYVEGENGPIVEGDIFADTVFGTLDSDRHDVDKIAVRYGRLWPDGVIPIAVQTGFSSNKLRQIVRAIQHWNDNTDLEFVDRTNQHDYVLFRPSNRCGSPVGRQGGRQIVELTDGCHVPQIIHEIGHAIGLYHTHSRRDRDEHVQILWDNIASGKHGFFNIIQEALPVGTYETNSVMHYNSMAFSRNGQPTILTISGGRIPIPSGLSRRDRAAINATYDQLDPQVSGAVE